MREKEKEDGVREGEGEVGTGNWEREGMKKREEQ